MNKIIILEDMSKEDTQQELMKLREFYWRKAMVGKESETEHQIKYIVNDCRTDQIKGVTYESSIANVTRRVDQILKEHKKLIKRLYYACSNDALIDEVINKWPGILDD